MITDHPIVTRLKSGWIGRFIRFYQAAAVNTLFGFGIYALMIRLGINIYGAQAIAQVLGVTFNYFTYSRHVFQDRKASKHAFLLAYLSNYVVNLLLLAIFDRVIQSSYWAGLASTLMASVINYLALRSLVFRRKAAAA